ncbi:hypothetical protein T439DRAFT_358407 [Meredithblackwellia eburnea MCA 4105]
MSNTPPTTSSASSQSKPATPAPSASSSSAAPAANPAQAGAAAPPASLSKYAVQSIPAWKGVSYANAAGKGKPSPATVNGVTATTATSTPPSAPAQAQVPAQAPPAPSSSSQAAPSPVATPSAPNAPASTSAAHSRQSSVKVESGVNVPPSRVSAIRGADPSVAFGNVNDKNAVLSSSPANPPTLNGNKGAPQTFGTLPAAAPASTSPAGSLGSAAGAGGKPAINLHSFFTGGGGAPRPGGPSPQLQASGNTSASSSTTATPAPPIQPSLSSSQLSSSSQAFAPRHIPAPFVPNQPFPGGSPSLPFNSYQGGNPGGPGSSPFAQHAKPPVVGGVPNGAAQPFQPGGSVGAGQGPNPNAPQQGGQRNGSFASPVLSNRGVPGGAGRQPPPPQFAPQGQQGATSPRMTNAGIPNQMMYQQWPQGGYPYPPGGYYQGPMQYQNMPPQPFPGQGAPGGPAPGTVPPSLSASGNSTPSTGVRTPSISGPGGVPPSPSPSPLAAMNPVGAATFTPGQPYSPSPQSATLPHHPQHQHVGGLPQPPHHFTPPPPRVPGSPFPLAAAAGAAEFKPSSDFLTPRKSAAIRIVNPKDAGVVIPPKKGAAPGTPTPAAATVPSQADKDAEEKKKTEEEKVKAEAEAEAKKNAAEEEEEKKKKDEQAAKEKAEAEEKARLEKEAEDQKKAEAEAVEKARLEKEAAEAKAKAEEEQQRKADEEAKAKAKRVEEVKGEQQSSTPSTPGEEVAGVQVRSSEAEAFRQEEVALLAADKVEIDNKDPATALAEAREAVNELKNANGDASKSKHVPGPLDLSATKSADVPSPLPSALASARAIDNLSNISYPANIKSPRADLNVSAEPGKYRYDREFLMQFMSVCVEKPESLPNLEVIGMIDAGSDLSGGRGGPGGPGGFPGNNRRSSMGPPAMPNRTHSSGGFGRVGSAGPFAMGNFSTTPAAGMTSSERFAASNAARNAAPGGFGGPPRTGSMSRTPSQGGVGGSNFQPARTRSDRGRVRGGGGGGGDRGGPGAGGGGGGGKHQTGDGFEGATLDNHIEDRWMPSMLNGPQAANQAENNSPEMVQRKVKALLNKLTLEKFESISDQILAWADKSVDETDGRILRQVIALIFEKATDEANFSEMYARLCRKLMEKVSNNVKDVNVKSQDGTIVAGGGLFRKYLLNRCQEDYENGWKQKADTAAAAANKAIDDNAKKQANEAAEKEAQEGGGSSAPKEAELLSDEYYAAQKAKRRGLGLVRFIGELYRLQMLTERIMHECIKKLLANTENPEEEDVESLCRLLTTVGKGLDTPKAKAHMDIYFTRMKMISDNPKVPSRQRFMIIDVLELRLDQWRPRNASTGPKLISEIHSDAQKAQEDAQRRTASSSGKGLPGIRDQLSRPNSRRGQGREGFGVPAVGQPGPDGWSAVPAQRPAKAGDLSRFGNIRGDSSAPINLGLGPSGAFAAKRAAKAKEEARPAASNPFSLLEESSSSASSRPKLVLAPRTKPLDGEEEEEGEEKAGEDAEAEDEDDGAIDPNAVSMSRAEAERRSDNSVKEFFSVKSISEGLASIEALPAEYRSFLITALSNSALDKKPADVNITRHLFSEVVAKSVVPHAGLLEAFEAPIKTLVDVAIDVPNAYNFMAQLLAGAGISRDEVEELSKKMESEEGEEEVEFGQKQLLAAVDKLSTN